MSARASTSGSWWRGSSSPRPITQPYDVACPANQFVVGISGEASGGGVHDISLHCAELLISGSPGAFSVGYGTITTVALKGTHSGTAFNDLLLAPKVVDRYRGRSGSWIDAIGIGDADVGLVLQQSVREPGWGLVTPVTRW